MKKIIFLLLIGIQFTYSQEKYKSSLIPEELKENANAVIREHHVSIEVNALDSMVITQRRVVTVLNKLGDQYVDMYEGYDDSRTIQKLSVLVLDRNGEIIEKHKKSDFYDISTVSNGQMYMDDRVKYLEYYPTSYPYTIVFESKIKEKSTAFLNSWNPISNYDVSIEQSSYNLKNHTDTKYKFKGYNIEAYDFKIDDRGNELSFFTGKNKAIEREDLSPELSKIMPSIRVALNEFELKGKRGNSENWKGFGLWKYDKLLLDRDVVDDATKNKILKLIADAPTEREKVKRIYNYVQENTRYVGVQLGIGGWQPIIAEEVDEVKYGDCKGLTNYTKALLRSQNIESYYTVVYAGEDKKSLDKDFTSLQGNHVFLNVPLKDETIWLECTSQTIPFGFLGSFTDDRDVLVIKPSGGEIMHTPVYDESINIVKTKGNILVNAIGGINADVEMESEGLQYNDRYRLETLSSEKQNLYYSRKWEHINGLKIESCIFKNDKDKVSFNEQLRLSISNYSIKVGDKLLVPLNPFNRHLDVPKKNSDRKLPFQTSRAFRSLDSYVFEVPSEYKVITIPENFEIINEFGSYRVVIEKKGANKLKYTRELVLKEGMFPKEKYNSYRAFIKKISKKDNSKFVLTKSL